MDHNRKIPRRSSRIALAAVRALALIACLAIPKGSLASHMGSVLSAYYNVLQSFSGNADSSKTREDFDTFFREAKTFLHEQKALPPEERDPRISLVATLANKMRAAQYIINRMRANGCMNVENSKMTAVSNQILLGALTANSCRHNVFSLDGFVKDIETLSSAITATPPLLQSESNLQNLQLRLKLAKNVHSKALHNNHMTQLYLDYMFRGTIPHCEKNDHACENFTKLLVQRKPPIDLKASLESANRILAEADSIWRQEVKEQNADGRVFPANESEMNPVPRYEAKIAELWNVPGMPTLAVIPKFQEQYGRELDHKFLRKLCMPSKVGSNVYTCRVRAQTEPNAIVLTEADILKILADGENSIHHFAKEELIPISKNLDSLERQSLILAAEEAAFAKKYPGKVAPTGEIRGVPPREIQALYQRRSSIRAQATLVNHILQEQLLKHPLEFGAALVENPELANTICTDIVTALENEEGSTILKHAVVFGVATGSVVATLASEGLFALVAGAGGALYIKTVTMEEHEESEKALQSLIASSLNLSALDRPISLSEFKKRYSHAKSEINAAWMLDMLSNLGVVSIGIEGTIHIINTAPRFSKITKALAEFDRIAVASGIPGRTAFLRLQTASKLAKRSDIGQSAKDMGLSASEAYNKITDAIREFIQEQEIKFVE